MKIAVILPCYNEENAIADVVAGFQKSLPDADVYVYDNASKDKTAEVATRAGAIVRSEPLKGKGNVVRRMFSDIDADIYVMADGDGTYDASVAPDMVQTLINNNADMVVGARAKEEHDEVYRRGHRFGNRVLNLCVHLIFKPGINDMLSGYRVFSKRFVKSFPASAHGFETETELTIHALQLRLPVLEVPTRYFKRAEGTHSKLSTYKDGIRILNFIMFFFKELKPFGFFGLIAAVLALASLVLGIPVVMEYFETGLVERFPTAFLSMGIMVCGVLSFLCGTILDSVSRGRLEHKRLVYLSYPAVQDAALASGRKVSLPKKKNAA